MKPEQRCDYDCINLIGSFKCTDSSEIGADQPVSNDDFVDYNMNNEMKDLYDADGNYDIIEGATSVSECSNGYYFNETISDCQGKHKTLINFHIREGPSINHFKSS